MTADELVEAISAILEREATPQSIQWTQAERDAYEEAGGWREGRDAVRRMRAAEIIELVRAQ